MEGLPDELGPEWRVLHPFEIPGVRFPTEDTPPHHRRLAENDTLVELIQTAEYLEDAPSWEQRRFYPLQYGDPYYRGRGRSHGRGRGRGRGWLNEDVTERDSGEGQGRTNFRGNRRGQNVLQSNWEYYRQDRSGLTSTHDEGRRDIRLEMPPEPGPSRFSDWSSLGLPPTRTPPHGAPDVQAEQIENLQNQLSVSTAVETRTERVETSNSEGVNISPQTEKPRENQSVPTIVRPAPLNIEVGTQRNDIESNEENANNIPSSQTRSVGPSLHADDVLLIRDVPQESNTHDDHFRDSQIRTQISI